jgi:diadenosine tetraphosphate (Ap4A) HIT family hydrolase
MSNCSLCLELRTGLAPVAAGVDTRIERINDDWVLFPSLGPVSPMHIIVMPRAHHTFSLRSDGAAQILAATSSALKEIVAPDSRLLMFEHANSSTGCGVLHAHVHAVTVPHDFDTESLFGNAVPTRCGLLGDLSGELLELFWCFESEDGLWAALDARLPSQTARRAVGAANSISFNADWKIYTHGPWFESSHRVARSLATMLRRSAWPAKPAA